MATNNTPMQVDAPPRPQTVEELAAFVVQHNISEGGLLSVYTPTTWLGWLNRVAASYPEEWLANPHLILLAQELATPGCVESLSTQQDKEYAKLYDQLLVATSRVPPQACLAVHSNGARCGLKPVQGTPGCGRHRTHGSVIQRKNTN